MNFLQQIYKGETAWWKWLIILAIFLPPLWVVYLRKIIGEVVSPLLSKSKNTSLVIAFLPYIALLIVFVFLFKAFHKRKLMTLITYRKKFDWVRFLFSFTSWGVISILMMIIAVYIDAENYIWNFNAISFIELLAICLTLMAVQVFFSEILIRAYTLQFFTYLFKKPWISLLFVVILSTVLMHLTNRNLLNLVGGEIFIYYLLTNFLLALIVVLDDGLEISLGMRMANNLIYLLFTSSRIYSFQRDSVMVNESGSGIFVVVYTSVLFYPLYFYFLKRLYKWSNWRDKLFKKVEKIEA